MKVRCDVYRVAGELSEKSGIDRDIVYHWLMKVFKEKKKRIASLEFRTADGLIFLAGERDKYRLESIRTGGSFSFGNGAADYWENKILERQEQD